MQASNRTTSLLLGLLAAILPTAVHAAVDPANWEKRQSVAITETGPVRFALPATLLDAANADLDDLRLLGPNGGEVPFALLLPQAPSPTERQTFAVEPRLEADRTILEVVFDAPRSIESLRFVTPASGFVKGVTIEARPGPAVAWEPLVTDRVIFRLSNRSESLLVPLRGAVTSELRISVDDDRDAPVPFTQVVAETRAQPGDALATQAVAINAVDHSTTETRLGLDFGTRHLHVATLELAVSDPAFKRDVRLIARRVHDDEIVEDTLATGTIHSLSLPGGRTFASLTLVVERMLPSARLELAIDNGDSPPLQVERITASLRPAFVALQVPTAGSYMLLAGNADANAPRYDVVAFASEWARLPTTAVRFGSIEANPAYRPTRPPPEVPEFAGLFDPEGWRGQRAVTIHEPGAQVLELDPALLAATRSDLGDIRLVRGDRQVPFLLERSSRERVLPLELEAAPDPDHPQIGRWRIELPFENLPITRLVFTIDEPLFERSAVVFERRETPRDGPRTFTLGEAHWARTGPDAPGRFAVDFHTPPRTREIFLQVYHGDNAAFGPTKVEASYPLRRLRFVANSPGEIALNFGHPTAHAPRYDLQLAAPLLLSAHEHTATLAPVESTAFAVERSGIGLGDGFTKYLFWGALVLVVVVLVWLVAKLLPKPMD